MHLTSLDWTIIAVAFAVYLAIGLVMGKSSGKDFGSYFLSGRALPWWLLGPSMVATTVAADLPNLVTGLVRRDGVFGNWVWWSFVLTGTTTAFLYAKLWRRSDLLTDVEFYELRYSGRPAAFLRGFRALYTGVIFNVILMANITLVAIKLGGVLLGLTPLQTIAIAAAVCVAYSLVGGLTGVLLTGLVQFAVATTGAIWAAVYVIQLPQVGGLSRLLTHPNVVPHLGLLPDFSVPSSETFGALFLFPLLVSWWAAYNPGAEPGGGGAGAQRMMAAKSEGHAVGATLCFSVLHFVLRPWPLILVALASLIVFPDVASLRAAFPQLDPKLVQHDLAYSAMLTFLPAGLLGLVVTSLLAAYLGTMATQLNWGASVLTNDLYRRFFRPAATERELVGAGRLATPLLMAAAGGLALVLRDALHSFELLLQIGSGMGLLLLLRWFWWRVNAAAELTAMAVSLLVAVLFQVFGDGDFSPTGRMLIGVAVTTTAWVLVAFFTAPTDKEVLRSFYRRVQPGELGWKHVLEDAEHERVQMRDPKLHQDLRAGLLAAACATVAIWALILATGCWLYGQPLWALALVALAVGGGIAVLRCWRRLSLR
ncbi:MAG TPA: sodium:solute symporter family protein [Candidatus Limnocylindria bacterium]|nr:sodium:solute symporter family protein [Candidatus Limnocylindria bacterium]